MLSLFDTGFRRVMELQLRDEGKVSMYVCGPTVYDVPHIGHGRLTLVWDVVRRYLEWSGYEVRFISNVTDIDDRIIQRANEEGTTSDDVATRYEKAWYEAVDRLGVKRPTSDPHATAYVDDMVALVAGLVEAGKAYETSDGVYLEVDRVPGYGLLARQRLDTLRAGARIEVDEEKRSPLDFALWKKSKPGEPTWPSPWGPGRPGWHTECVVMSLDLLGEDFDLHAGGLDLAFPHHENERAQAIAAGRAFARRWSHSGLVEVGGEKMSKSLGNFTTLTDLLDAVDPRAYRMLVLQSHYRAPLEVTANTLEEQASNTLANLDDFARHTRTLPDTPADEDALARFRERMDDDMDTPQAVAHLFDVVRRTNVALAAGDAIGAAPLAAAVREMAAAVGLELAGAEEIPAEIEALAARREEARRSRDYAAADQIRDELAGQGWLVEDTPAGPLVHRKS